MRESLLLSFALSFALREQVLKHGWRAGRRLQKSPDLAQPPFGNRGQHQLALLLTPGGRSTFLQPELFTQLDRNHHLPFGTDNCTVGSHAVILLSSKTYSKHLTPVHHPRFTLLSIPPAAIDEPPPPGLQ